MPKQRSSHVKYIRLNLFANYFYIRFEILRLKENLSIYHILKMLAIYKTLNVCGRVLTPSCKPLRFG